MKRLITYIHVHAINLSSTRALLRVGTLVFPCSLGRSGRIHRKREGDGGTPVGIWTLRRVFYRQDMICRPAAAARAIRATDGWCEKRGDRNYNRLVRLPYAAAHESMKRDDDLYNVVVELSHNERPRVQGHGSAVFFHLRRADGGPTAGCVAVSLKDMKTILSLVRHDARIVVWSSAGPLSPLRRKSPSPRAPG